MTDIPQDILAAAENTLDKMLCNCHEAGDVRQDSIRDIARAILAERERCALIADREGVYSELNIYAGGPDWYRHGKRIRDAIRTPTEQPNVKQDQP